MRTMNQEKVERLAAFVNQYARDNNGSSPSLSEIMEYNDVTSMIKFITKYDTKTQPYH